MFIVDRVENDYVVLEDYETREIINVRKGDFSFSLSDGDVLRFVDGKYIKDLELKKMREDIINEKIKKLKNI